jgi:Transposase DDE domain./Transposase domain (DUF772).
MFKKTDKNTQLDMYFAPDSVLNGRSLALYQEKSSWHNVFRKDVLTGLKEDIFECLFSKDNGAPNASIRVLVCMMVLKEMQGLSDSQLYEQCRFNLLTRSALGLLNMSDPVPVESTYYLFRKRIVEYEKETGINLLEKAFSQLTSDQIKEFQVNGKLLRMDSKLIGSNIAWYSRYELIHEAVRVFCKSREKYIQKRNLAPSDIALLKSIMDEGGNKVVYRSSKTEITMRMKELGVLTYKLLAIFRKFPGDDYDMLKKVFYGQFSVGENKEVVPLEKDKIESTSVQSPHDTDCTYRNKDGNKVKGYSANVTETCNQEKGALNLITDVKVDKVTTADSTFFAPAVESSQEKFSEKVEEVYADGAYHSPDNQAFCKENNMELITQAIQGTESRYEFSQEEETGNILVTDTVTGQIIPARKSISKKDNSVKWVIKTAENKPRYFTNKDIENFRLRQIIKNTPRDKLNIRNNVEATIFQLCYHFSNDKTKYRTLCKHKMWANLRAISINFGRILKYVKQTCQRTLFPSNQALKIQLENACLTFIFIFNHIFIYNTHKFSPKPDFSTF